MIKTDPRSPLPAILKRYVEQKYPHPENNPYLDRLSRNRRTSFKLIRAGRFTVLKTIFKIKNFGK